MSSQEAAPNKPKKRAPSPTGRLSDNQKQILLWLLARDPRLTPLATDPNADMKAWPGIHIPWRPKEFLGQKPTPSDTASISNALKALETRGLISRRSLTKSGIRTSHVLFTPRGRVLAEALADKTLGIDPEGLALDEHQRNLAERATGLELALKYLNAELDIAATDVERSEKRRAWNAVFEALGTLQAELRKAA